MVSEARAMGRVWSFRRSSDDGVGPISDARPTPRAGLGRPAANGAFLGAVDFKAPRAGAASPVGGRSARIVLSGRDSGRGIGRMNRAAGWAGETRGRMKYGAFQAQADMLAPARLAAGMANAVLGA